MPRPDEGRPASPAVQDYSDAPLRLSTVRARHAAPQHDSALRAAGAGAPAPDPTPPALIRKCGRSVAAPLPPGSSTTFSKDSGSRTQDSEPRKQNISASEGRRPTENRCRSCRGSGCPRPAPRSEQMCYHSTTRRRATVRPLRQVERLSPTTHSLPGTAHTGWSSPPTHSPPCPVRRRLPRPPGNSRPARGRSTRSRCRSPVPASGLPIPKDTRGAALPHHPRRHGPA